MGGRPKREEEAWQRDFWFSLDYIFGVGCKFGVWFQM